MYSCIDGPNNDWYFDYEVEFACNNDDSSTGVVDWGRSLPKLIAGKEKRGEKRSRKNSRHLVPLNDAFATSE